MTTTLTTRVRASVSSEVFAICVIIFVADIVTGIIIPTFSLYARNLGVSLGLLGGVDELELDGFPIVVVQGGANQLD